MNIIGVASWLRGLLLPILFLLAMNGCARQDDNTEQLDVEFGTQSPRPNIVLILTDDQGYGDVGRHQNPVVSTPNIDQLAEESVRFTNFHVDPTCSPTRAALLTGMHSMQAGVWHTVMGRSFLATEHKTLAEVLLDAGYSTALFGKWHLGDNYPFRPQDQGFEYTVMHGGGGVGQSGDYWGNDQFDDTYYRNGQPEKFEGYATDIWFQEAVDYIKTHAQTGKPFFTYISTNAPHTPWRANEDDIQIYRDIGLPEPMSRFYAMVTSIDSGVGAIRQELARQGIEEQTLLIFMTDNGTSSLPHKDIIFEELNSDQFLEEFKANPAYADWVINAGMRGSKGEVYEGGHRVPFFLNYPNGNFGEPRDQSELLAHFDLMPTLGELLGLREGLLANEIDGKSFASVLDASGTQESEFANRKLVVTNQRVPDPRIGRPMVVMSKEWRFISERDRGIEELYNIRLDPEQSSNVIDQFPHVANEYRDHLNQWWSDVSENIPDALIPIVGSEHENPVRLNANDWAQAGSTSEIAWYPGFRVDFLPEEDIGWISDTTAFIPLPWEVEVASSDEYRVSTYVFDEPANTPVNRDFAFLEIDGELYKTKLEEGAVSADFVVHLKKGREFLKGWFANADEEQLAAYYMYIERLYD